MLVRNHLRRWAVRLAIAAPLGGFCAPLVRADDAPKPPEPAAIFKQLDKNGDGTVTRDEVPEDQIRFFERVLRTGDKDGSGTLTQDEFVAGTADTERRDAAPGGFGGPGPGGRGPGEMFERLDSNKDGKIQKSEVPDPLQRMLNPLFERLGKEEISREEFLEAGRRMMAEGGRPGGGPGFGPMGPPGEVFSRMDRNGDGKLSKDEVPEPASRFFNPLFERLGKNEITKEEFEEAGRQMRERFGGRPGMGPGGAPGGGSEGRSSPEGRARVEEMFKRLDKNEDGKLTVEEAPEEAKARIEGMLERMGKGKDGSITREEFLGAVERMMGGGRGPGDRGPEGRGPEGRGRGPDGRGPDGPPPPRDGERGPEGRGRGPEGRGPDGPPPPRDGERGPEGRGRGPEGRGPDGPPPPRDGERGPEGRGRGPEGRGPDGPPPPRDGDRGPEGRGPEERMPQGRGPMGEGRLFGPPGLPPNLARFDENKDGRLSRPELERLLDKFTELDRNGDGQLDMPELMGGPPPGGGRPPFGGPGFGGRGPEGRGPDGPPRDGQRPPEGRGPGDRGPEGRGPEGRGPEGRGRDGDRPPPPRDGDRPERPRPPQED